MKGFTLVELLIVIGISIILAVAAAPLYNSLHVNAQLDETTKQLVQTFRTARQHSIAGYRQTEHSVAINSNSFMLINNNLDSEYNRTVQLDPALILTWHFSNASNTISFAKSNGLPTATGTVTISHQAGNNKTISINDLGITTEN